MVRTSSEVSAMDKMQIDKAIIKSKWHNIGIQNPKVAVDRAFNFADQKTCEQKVIDWEKKLYVENLREGRLPAGVMKLRSIWSF